MTDFDELAAGGDSSDGALQRIIGMCVRPACLSSVELELTECADLAAELAAREIGEEPVGLEFIETPEDGEIEVAPQPPQPLPPSSVMVAARLNAASKPWRDRIALSRTMPGCSWPRFRAACVEHGMTAGESAEQLIALLKPYWAAAEAAVEAERKSQ
jgi:hypothetical protein